MTKVDFIASLRNELRDVPMEEREEAIKYYTEYFEDAGAENEQTVIKELVSPMEVAQTIKANCTGITLSKDVKNGYKEGPHQSTTSRTVLIIIIVIISSPVWIGLVAGVFGLFAGVVGAMIGLIVACGALLVSGIIGFLASLPIVALNTPSGLIMAGIFLVTAAAGLMLGGLLIFLVGKGVPAVGRAIGNLFKRRH